MKALSILVATIGLSLAAPGPNAPMAVAVGEPALLFTLPAINEDAAVASVGTARVSLGDFTGVAPARPARAVLLHFFDKDASANSQLATLERLQRKHGGKGLQVVAVTTDDSDLGSLSTWVEDQKVSFPVLRDNHRVVQGRYKISGAPLSILVDADSRVFAIGNPSGETMESELEGELIALLNR